MNRVLLKLPRTGFQKGFYPFWRPVRSILPYFMASLLREGLAMKKLTVLSIALVFVFAIFIPQAIAKKDKVVKVDICHVIAAMMLFHSGPWNCFSGK